MAQKKAFIYIDGFNLFYSLKDNGWKKYYWLDVVKLSSELLRPGHYLSLVKYYTSRIKKPITKQKRQNSYLNALYTKDFIKIKYGRYQPNEIICNDCGRVIPVPKEKKTDVNIATEMIIDAVTNKCDVQYLLSGDSDLAPAFEKIKEFNSNREIYLICPPKTVLIPGKEDEFDPSKNRISGELIQLSNSHQYIKEKHLQDCQFDVSFTNRSGKVVSKPEHWK